MASHFLPVFMLCDVILNVQRMALPLTKLWLSSHHPADVNKKAVLMPTATFQQGLRLERCLWGGGEENKSYSALTHHPQPFIIWSFESASGSRSRREETDAKKAVKGLFTEFVYFLFFKTFLNSFVVSMDFNCCFSLITQQKWQVSVSLECSVHRGGCWHGFVDVGCFWPAK